MNLELLWQIIEAVKNPINLLFIIGIIGFFFLSKGNWHKSTFTTIGMLGTFIGICYGLLVFDSEDIDGSIPELLSGLKTALITSIVGMIASLLYHPFWKRIKKDEFTAESPIENLIASTENNTRIMKEGLEKLVVAMGGDQDNSLISQIKLMRIEINTGNKNLQRSFDEFAEKISKASTEEIVKALREVIKNFNEKITDQFGEHFKHLNEGVEKLVIWQEKYKEYMDEAQIRLDNSLNIIEKAENSMHQIKEKTDNLPDNLNALENIIELQKQQIIDLSEKLSGFAGMKEQAISAMPIIQENLDKLTTEFKEQAQSSVSNISKDFEGISDNFANALKKSINSSEQERKELTKTITTAIVDSEQARESLTYSIASISDDVKKQVESSSIHIEELLNSVFVQYSESMENQMKDIIGNMGSQLTSISHHLAQDYETFTVNFAQATDKIKELNA